MTASFVRLVTAIITEVANLATINAITISTFEVAENVGATSRPIGTQGHVVLVGPITTIIFAVANIIPRYTFEIGTLEFMNVVASEGPTKCLFFIAAISAIISSVAKIIMIDT